MGPFSDSAAAIKEFMKKFKDKTKNDWNKRDVFKPVPGKYTLIEMDDDEDDDEEITEVGTEINTTFPSSCFLISVLLRIFTVRNFTFSACKHTQPARKCLTRVKSNTDIGKLFIHLGESVF